MAESTDTFTMDDVQGVSLDELREAEEKRKAEDDGSSKDSSSESPQEPE